MSWDLSDFVPSLFCCISLSGVWLFSLIKHDPFEFSVLRGIRVCLWATLPCSAENEARAVFSARFCRSCRGQTAEYRVYFGGWLRLEWCGISRFRDQNSSSGPSVRSGGSAGELLRPAAVHSIPKPADDRPLPGQKLINYQWIINELHNHILWESIV